MADNNKIPNPEVKCVVNTYTGFLETFAVQAI